MSRVYLMAADHPLPLMQYRRKIEINGIKIEHDFSIQKHQYYRYATEQLGYNIKPYQYELQLYCCENDLNDLSRYLQKHLSDGEEIELWSLWVGDIPGRLRRYRGQLLDFDMDTLTQFCEFDNMMADGQVCFTIYKNKEGASQCQAIE